MVKNVAGGSRTGRPKGATSFTSGRSVSVALGCDCSGIETPVMALESLGVPVDHRFSCDNDPDVKKVVLANFKAKVFFDDVTKRDNSSNSVLKGLDLYVAGFPCQTFSAQGKNAGTGDPRGLIVLHVIRFIKECRPKGFVLENVKGLVSKPHRKTFLTIMR